MVKKFTIPCNFAGTKHPVSFYIGDAAVGSHPIEFQTKWLRSEKGGEVPDDLMKSLANLKEIADKNKVPFADLCNYVIEEINYNKQINDKNGK